MSDHPVIVNSRALSRLDALPGSLGKVSLCAAIMSSIATYVSVRSWLAKRAAAASSLEEDEVMRSKWRWSSGASKKSALMRRAGGAGESSSGIAPTIGGNAACGGGNGQSDIEAVMAGGGMGSSHPAGGSASPSQRPQLPQRNYFTVRASLHVKRHSSKLMEWHDAQLGVQMPFSPLFFDLEKEERQAPLILLTFRTVREPTHRMAVTIEELFEPQTASAYSEASLRRIADCANITGQTTTRVGGKDYPTAEYCYVDEQQSMNYVFSTFVAHERLAVTVQYVTPTRARNVVPAAVYDMVRNLAFVPPCPSPSYLLVSEPRLGLGYHLPVDFLVHEGLAEGDGTEDRLFKSTMATGYDTGGHGGGSGGLRSTSPGGLSTRQQHPRGATGVDGFVSSPYSSPSYHAGNDDNSYGDGGAWMAPYATAMSRGRRRMGLIASYEPACMSPELGSRGGGGSDAAASTGGGGVPYAWRLYLEQQVCKAVQQLGLVLGSSTDSRAPQIVFQAPDAAHPPSRRTVVVEPYPLSIVLTGDFSTVDDIREEDGDAVAHVTAFSLFREVRVDVNGTYLALVPGALDTAGAVAAACSTSAMEAADSSVGMVKAYWSAFYVPVGTACVSFHFIASAHRHSSTEFISFCATVMNSVSLGNHHGQSVSVFYCNTRHDVLPFRLSLPPTGMSTVEEPMLADPLCVVHVPYGVEKVTVTVRVFPLFASITSSAQGGVSGGGGVAPASATTMDGRPVAPSKAVPPRPIAERFGSHQRSLSRQLQYMVRYYLSQFPGGVNVVSHERIMLNAMPAILVCFKPLWHSGSNEEEGFTTHAGAGGGSGSPGPPSSSVINWGEIGGGCESSQITSDVLSVRDALLEEEIGQLNPFAQYYPPPPPPPCYLSGEQQPPRPTTASSGAAGKESTGLTAASLHRTSNATDGVRGGDEAGVRDDHESRFYGLRGDESQRSHDELDNPLRVAIAVCYESNAFLFQTSASEYTQGISIQALRTLATYLAPIPRSG